MKKPYHIVNRDAACASAQIETFAKANGQLLLPLVGLITQSRIAVDEVMQQIGRQTVELILELSAQEVAGPRTPGKPSGEVRWHGAQRGRVQLATGNCKGNVRVYATSKKAKSKCLPTRLCKKIPRLLSA